MRTNFCRQLHKTVSRGLKIRWVASAIEDDTRQKSCCCPGNVSDMKWKKWENQHQRPAIFHFSLQMLKMMLRQKQL